MELIFEISKPGRQAADVPASDVPSLKNQSSIKNICAMSSICRKLQKLILCRHYTNLSRRNFGVDLGFYPLGSCTMKYNPKVNEAVAALPVFTDLHPYAPTNSRREICICLLRCSGF